MRRLRRWLQAFISALARQKRQVTRQKFSIDCRPRSNRRRHRYTAPHAGMAADPFWYNVLESAGDRLRRVRSNETRDSDPPAPRNSPLPTLKGERPSRRDAALKPVDLQGQPMELREPPRAVREQPAHLRKERARLRGEPMRWQEQPTGLGTAPTAPRPKAMGLGRRASASPSPPWIAARCAH